MRNHGKAAFGIVLLVLSAVASAEDCTAVGYVNISQVIQRVGYDKMYLLGADPEIQKELQKLSKEKDALTRDLVAAKDQEALKEITERVRLLEAKHTMLAKNTRRSNSREAQNWVKTFVAEKYGKHYALIVTRRLEDDTTVIHQSLNIDYLTDKVVQDVSAMLESLGD